MSARLSPRRHRTGASFASCSSTRTIGLTGAVSPPRDARAALAPDSTSPPAAVASSSFLSTGPSSTSPSESALSLPGIAPAPSPPVFLSSDDEGDGDAPRSLAARSAAIARCASSARVHRVKMTENVMNTAICAAPGGGEAPGSSSTTTDPSTIDA